MDFAKDKKSFFLIFLVLLLSLLVTIPLFKKGFFPTHDFIYVARIQQLDKAIKDGHFPVRWAPDFRYGDPTFNYYAPLPYYLGSGLHNFLQTSFLDTAKILFALSLILSGLGMFLYGRLLFGKLGGLVSAVLYVYAPYRSVDIYVRGTMNEAWAFVFFPLIFFFAEKLKKKATLKNIFGLALVLSLLFSTHNIMTVLFLPFFMVYVGFLFIRNKKRKQFCLGLTLSAIWSFLLGASYLLPAFLEKSFIQTQFVTAGYFDFAGHFVAVRQWFIRNWGYGASLWGPIDDMSFQIGITHWVLIFGGCLVWFLSELKNLKKRKIGDWDFLVFVGLFILSLFMQHNLSTFIWKSFPILAFTQFPWRFLAISVFFASILSGYLFKHLKLNRSFIVLATIILTFFVNINYFKPQQYYSDSIDEHYAGPKVYTVNDRVPRDYLPIWVKKAEVVTFNVPYFLDGLGTISDYQSKTQQKSLTVNVTKAGKIIFPLTYFPGWTVYIDDAKGVVTPSDNGLVIVNIEAGKHDVKLLFQNTFVRLLGNGLTLGGLLASIVYFAYGKSKKSH
jgi:hypothetical protein